MSAMDSPVQIPQDWDGLCFHPDTTVEIADEGLILVLGNTQVCIAPFDHRRSRSLVRLHSAGEDASSELFDGIPDCQREMIRRELRSARILINSSDLQGGALSALSLYLSANFAEPSCIYHRLHDLTIGVVGLGGLGSHVVITCAGSGFRKFKIADGGLLSPGDALRQASYLGAENGSSKAQLLKDRLLVAAPWCEINVRRNDLCSLDEIENFCEDVDLLLWMADTVDYYTVYSAAWHSRTPIVSAGVGIESGFVGPLIDRNSDLCYRCFRAAEVSALGRCLTSGDHRERSIAKNPLRSSLCALNLRVASVVAAEVCAWGFTGKSRIRRGRLNVTLQNESLKNVGAEIRCRDVPECLSIDI